MFTSVGVILLTWHLRTRHIDFLTPKNTPLPPEDFGTDLAAGSAALQPPIQNETPEPPPPPVVVDDPEAPEILEITESDLGDLESSPGLATYRAIAKNGDPSQLFLLSSTLRIQGQFQRSLIALERIVDTSEATPEELLEAGKGIAALSSELPQWTTDPTTEIPVVLEISIPHTAGDPIKSAALALATLIRQRSGGQLNPIPKINSLESETTLDNPPIALWFSSHAEAPIQSAVMTMTPSGEPAALLDELSLAAYQAVRSHLTKFDFPAPIPLEASGQEMLSLQVTRLMWRDFAKSLYPEASPPLEPETPEISTEELAEEEN